MVLTKIFLAQSGTPHNMLARKQIWIQLMVF
ncbi:hypothetical protein IGB42_04278 [Andreprevotia sp. IGB-42]|nr:hypothetical protein IGB42_04278 [Andreprevotia sp. IGB-42]